MSERITLGRIISQSQMNSRFSALSGSSFSSPLWSTGWRAGVGGCGVLGVHMLSRGEQRPKLHLALHLFSKAQGVGMATDAGTMQPLHGAHCAGIITLFVPPPPPLPSRPASWHRDGRALTRITMPPPVDGTMEGHGHRPLCGPEGATGLSGCWRCQPAASC